MALPTDSSDTFLREVDENYRRDRLRDFLRDYGKWLALALVLFLGGIAGWIYWQNQKREAAAQESVELQSVFADVGRGQTQKVPQRLQALEKSDSDIVRASAILTGAALSLEKNDRSQALAKYRELADDDGMPQVYRDAASIRLTALEFDTLQPQQVIARLEPLAKPGNPWFGSAGEMTALAHLKAGRRNEAARIFAAIAADRQVPDTLRSRAVQIAGTLGVDASASLPSLEQQETR